jgi:hypothetical protein
MTPEGYVKKAVKAEIEVYGDQAYTEMPVPSGFGKSGLDFNICFFGRWVSVETKKPGGKATDRQKLRIREIHAAGGIAMVIDSVEAARTGLRAVLAGIAEDAGYVKAPK